MTTVSNEDRKDTDMKLLLIFAAILAFSLAEQEKTSELAEDSQAEASAYIELQKEGVDLNGAASTYTAFVPPSQRPPHWNAPNYVPPQNTWTQPAKPIQPVNTGVPANVQNDYYYVPTYRPPTTTPAVPVIKNEQYWGENGHYRYEYKIADGTWVGEEGWYTDPKQTEESLVKKGWYSYVGADKKTYTVTYWADHTGYHAYGDHLPTPPPAYQAAINTEHQKPQNDYPTQTPAPIYYPTQTPAPVHYHPTSEPYVPPQQPAYVPPQQPAYVPPQQPAYVPPQQPAYIPPQLPAYPPQQPSYPPQQNCAINTEHQKPQNDYPTQTPAPIYYPTQTPAPVHYHPTSEPYVPPQQPAYVPPQQPAYVPPQQPAYVPPQQPAYIPPQLPAYPPQQPSYPPQQNW